LLTIWRAAAAIEASRILQAQRVRCIAAGSRQIADKCAPTPFGQNQKRSSASVGVSLLTIWRAVAATEATVFLQAHRVRCFAAGSRQIADKCAPTPFGQNQKRSGASVGVSLLTIWRAAAAM
jgi:hypothetical protein